MYNRILFPTDGSAGATAVLDHVLELAAAHEATLYILNVADTTQMSTTRIRGEVVDTLEQEGEEIVEETTARVDQSGITTVTEVMQGEPYSTIVEYADAREMDLIVMPTHGRRGIERFLLGSTTERVVRRANVPVLTIQWDDGVTVEYPYQGVLVPTDGSDCATHALELGVDVATANEASLHLLSVVALPSFGADVPSDSQTTAIEEQAKDLIAEARTVAEAGGVGSIYGTVESGQSIHRVILSYIEEHDIDIVVVGTHGRTGFDRYMLGSVTEYLVRTSPVPVLTIRRSAQET